MRKSFILFAVLLFSYNVVGQTLVAQPSLPMLPTGNDDSFIVIAHRGASSYAPENTHAAFQLAIEMNAEMIELDLTLSKDGVPVVIHDETLDRTSNGTGKVGDQTLENLKRLDVGGWFDSEFKGEPFPTLEEVLAYTKDKIAVNIEIKHEAVTDQAVGGIVDKALQVVEKTDVKDQVIFSSFDYRVMEHLNELDANMPKAILYDRKQSGDMLPSQIVEKYSADTFNCSYRQLTKEWLDDLKSHDIPFLVYTVNDEKLMTELIKKGATGIFSDKPDVLKTIVDNL